ncbi:MAG: Mur ligase family protein [Limnohabitans sp.]
MLQLRDLPVLILGLGASGLAMARWCVGHGAVVTVADTRQAPPQLDAFRAECPQAGFVSGPLEAALVEGTSIRAVFRSPGLSPETVAPVVDAARAMGLWQGGELDLFAAGLQALRERWGYRPQVLAITGTNGKTTVTSLTGQLVARAGKTVRVAGNIGPTLLDTLGEAITLAERDATALQVRESSNAAEKPELESAASPALDIDPADEPENAAIIPAVPAPMSAMARALPQVWVLELSSFQLDGSEGFEPTAATVLNISQDHLDWHGSMQAYSAAKARIFGQQALMVLNRDDAGVMALHEAVGALHAGVPTPPQGDATLRTSLPRSKGSKGVERSQVSFGADMPSRPGDWGIESVNGMTWLVRALQADEPLRRGRAHEQELHIQRLMPADALRIRGRHNAVNALAALALASSAGCSLAPMLYGLREYRGEPHRVEPVAIVNEVEYFDDSKGTNVGATVAALQGLGVERRLVVILGGDGKGQDVSPLADPVARHARAVLLIGRDAGRIRQALSGGSVPLHDAPDLPQAVEQAAALARPGDAVLMSPACASFDMFDHYGHRAQVFRQSVARLAEAAGLSLEGAL